MKQVITSDSHDRLGNPREGGLYDPIFGAVGFRDRYRGAIEQEGRKKREEQVRRLLGIHY